ncbi:hypothetical protein [Algivirga pacifica]|uniref:HTH cro/C1-type domain-containing protein n=1 Tax=Algivirga pacifica TaxID=1162670 RepID=A0ABP9D9W4_9BACT
MTIRTDDRCPVAHTEADQHSLITYGELLKVFQVIKEREIGRHKNLSEEELALIDEISTAFIKRIAGRAIGNSIQKEEPQRVEALKELTDLFGLTCPYLEEHNTMEK